MKEKTDNNHTALYRLNILEDMDNSSRDIFQNALNFQVDMGYRILPELRINALLAYGFSNVREEKLFYNFSLD